MPSAPARPAPAGPAHARLRSATDTAHAALDGALSTLDLSDPQGYAAFLAVHAAAQPPLEAALTGGAAEAVSPRAALLADDLAGLGAPLPPPLPCAPLGREASWGVAYVLEGARLGARLLAARAARAPDPRIAANRRYLSAPRRMGWAPFLAGLEAGLTTPAARDIAARAALGAFVAFQRAYNALGCPVEAARQPRKVGT